MSLNPYEVKTKEDMLHFVASLMSDLDTNKNDWENPNLESFLEGMKAWLEDSGTNLEPDWRTFAIILSAGKSYE
ncbi:hypothetical protein AB4Z50_28260 [Paenibacillus sp. 2TAB26]|uniref:DUF7660 family protein n=1 Tax=Paenibacillus sp. 2TAB26 TaxID=3233005 RepID=UPI003F99DB5F